VSSKDNKYTAEKAIHELLESTEEKAGGQAEPNEPADNSSGH